MTDRRAAQRQRDEWHKQITRQMRATQALKNTASKLSGPSRGDAPAPTGRAGRAGEGNRTPIFGLGSQRLSHWTTPAEVGSVTDADTLADVRMRVFWPVTLAAALLVGLLAYGVFSKGGDTTLDEAVAKGERPTAPVASLPALGADGNLSLADYKGKVVVLNVWASWCDPCREEMPLLQTDARADLSPGRDRARRGHAGRVAQGARVPQGGRRDVPERARPRPRVRAPSSASTAIRRRSSSTGKAGSRRCSASRSRRRGWTSTCRSC